MGIYLREKKLGNGQVSFYLDIYHNKTRWYEFLEIRINKNKPTEKDKENKNLAQQIRTKREHELTIQDYGLVNHNQKKADFVQWCEAYYKSKKWYGLYGSALLQLKTYTKNRPLPFTMITPQWLKGFTDHLLGKVSNNSALSYFKVIFTGLEEAVKQNIIHKNPCRLLDKKDWLRKQDIFRSSFTIEQLQKLVNTPCKIHPQIKQAFLFSCFTGLRWSDVNPLKWSEIIIKNIGGEERYFIYFEQEKTEGIEYLPLSAQAIEIFKQRQKEKELEEQSIYVFPFIKEYDQAKYLMHKRVGLALKKWGKAMGIESHLMHFHASRHSFATNVLEHSPDGDLYTVSKLLGHKSIISTQIYAKIRDKRRVSAVNSLPTLTMPQ